MQAETGQRLLREAKCDRDKIRNVINATQALALKKVSSDVRMPSSRIQKAGYDDPGTALRRLFDAAQYYRNDKHVRKLVHNLVQSEDALVQATLHSAEEQPAAGTVEDNDVNDGGASSFCAPRSLSEVVQRAALAVQELRNKYGQLWSTSDWSTVSLAVLVDYEGDCYAAQEALRAALCGKDATPAVMWDELRNVRGWISCVRAALRQRHHREPSKANRCPRCNTERGLVDVKQLALSRCVRRYEAANESGSGVGGGVRYVLPHIKAGLLDGVGVVLHPNGRLALRETYRGGKLCGHRFVLDEHGMVVLHQTQQIGGAMRCCYDDQDVLGTWHSAALVAYQHELHAGGDGGCSLAP
ncbi:Hypothetical protein UVM_LOCUS111 [uncultured virus]|nr:Hypothetical protein UVM_LOCUS111 [uncultured virus]